MRGVIFLMVTFIYFTILVTLDFGVIGVTTLYFNEIFSKIKTFLISLSGGMGELVKVGWGVISLVGVEAGELTLMLSFDWECIKLNPQKLETQKKKHTTIKT